MTDDVDRGATGGGTDGGTGTPTGDPRSVAGTIRVLLVDDDPDFADLAATFLERVREGIVVETATDADRALERLSDDDRTDCVVSDYDMPGMNGLEFLDAVGDRRPDLPFFLLTGHGSEEVASEAISAGVTDYLRKGSGSEQFETLANRIERAVSRRRAERNYREIFEKANDGIVLHDSETGELLDANERFCEMLGYDRSDLLSMSVGELSAVEDGFTQAAAERHIGRAVEEGTRTFEWVVETASGERRPIEVTLNRTTIDGAERVLAFVRDVSERRRLKTELEEVLGRVTDAFLGLDDRWRITYVNDRAEELLDRSREDLLGEDFWEAFEEATERDFYDQYRRAMDAQESVAFVEYYPPLDRWFAMRAYPSDTGLSVYFRDVSDRKRREERLASFNEMLAEITAVDDRQRLCNIAVETARDRLDLPVTMIAGFDAERGSLRPVARTPLAQAHVDGALLGAGGPAWAAFTSAETAVLDGGDVDALDGSLSDTRLFVCPLGRHGVFVTATGATDDGTDERKAFVETVGGDLKRALDRIEREELLRDRESVLEEQNERLDRLNRINDVIRRIDRVLVGATTCEQIKQAVCEELADDGPYRFAWIGEYDSTAERVEVQTWAGDGRGYLDEVDAESADAPTDGDPTTRAVRTREPQAVTDVLADPPIEPWRAAALKRGYRSCIALPLLYRERLYGALTVYADSRTAFGETEREVLCELAETIANAISSVRSKRMLGSDEVVALEFEVPTSEVPLLATVRGIATGDVDLESVVPAADGTHRVCFRLEEASQRDVAESVKGSTVVREGTLIAEDGESTLVECAVTDESLVGWLLDHGAIPESITVDERGSRVTVELADDDDVRSFVDLVQRSYPGTELVARRQHERTVRTRREFRADLKDRLTPRQNEVIHTAYVSGFFETPRKRTGQEIAASIGITQPTFSTHLRSGLRTLVGMIYGNPVDDPGE